MNSSYPPQNPLEMLMVMLFVSDSPRITTNPFSLKTIPPFSLLTTWDKQLSFWQKEEKGYYYLQHGSQCFSISDIKDMLKVHYARDLQRAVQAELNWFSEPYIKPLTVQMYPPESSIKKFQEILYFNSIHQMKWLLSVSHDGF